MIYTIEGDGGKAATDLAQIAEEPTSMLSPFTWKCLTGAPWALAWHGCLNLSLAPLGENNRRGFIEKWCNSNAAGFDPAEDGATPSFSAKLVWHSARGIAIA